MKSTQSARVYSKAQASSLFLTPWHTAFRSQSCVCFSATNDGSKPLAAAPGVSQDDVALAALQKRMRDSYTMSQVYVKDRPAPIPMSEYERKRKAKELEEISAAGRRKGVSAEVIKANLEQIDQILPSLVNLHKAKASDWVMIVKDVNAVISKLVILRELFPKANLEKVLQNQPKLLLKSEAQLKEDGQKVLQVLATSPDPDAIIEAVPDLINPVSLVRSLAYIKSSFGGVDPVELLTKNPEILLNMGESNIEDSAEYGESRVLMPQPVPVLTSKKKTPPATTAAAAEPEKA